MDTHNAPRVSKNANLNLPQLKAIFQNRRGTDTAGDVHVQNGTQMPVQADVEKISQNLKYLNHDQLANIVAKR